MNEIINKNRQKAEKNLLLIRQNNNTMIAVTHKPPNNVGKIKKLLQLLFSVESDLTYFLLLWYSCCDRGLGRQTTKSTFKILRSVHRITLVRKGRLWDFFSTKIERVHCVLNSFKAVVTGYTLLLFETGIQFNKTLPPPCVHFSPNRLYTYLCVKTIQNSFQETLDVLFLSPFEVTKYFFANRAIDYYSEGSDSCLLS